MMYSLNMNEFDDILNNITDDEILMYESTEIDNILISWAKENCKDNYISLKKRTLIDNLISNFDEDEELLDYFTAWDYTTDYFRISTSFIGARAAAIPTNDWSKNSIFALSNKRLYIINSGQYYDYINTITYDLNNPKTLKDIKLYKIKNAELLQIRSNGTKMMYKIFSSHFSSLLEEIKDSYPICSKISIYNNKKPPTPIGKIIMYIYIIFVILFGLSAIPYAFNLLT